MTYVHKPFGSYVVDILTVKGGGEYTVALKTSDILGLIKIWNALPKNLAEKVRGGIAVDWADASFSLCGLGKEEAQECLRIAADTLALDLSDTFYSYRVDPAFRNAAKGSGSKPYKKAATESDAAPILKSGDSWENFSLFVYPDGYILCYRNTTSIDKALRLEGLDLPRESWVAASNTTTHVKKGRLYARADTLRGERQSEALGRIYFVPADKTYLLGKLLNVTLNLGEGHVSDIVLACEQRMQKLRLGETGGEYVVETGERGPHNERLFFTVNRKTDLVPEAPKGTAIWPDVQSHISLAPAQRVAGR